MKLVRDSELLALDLAAAQVQLLGALIDTAEVGETDRLFRECVQRNESLSDKERVRQIGDSFTRALRAINRSTELSKQFAQRFGLDAFDGLRDLLSVEASA